MITSVDKPMLNGCSEPCFTVCSLRPLPCLNFVSFVILSTAKRSKDNEMRELNCVVRLDSGGWCVIVCNTLRGRYGSKDEAIRAAIVEAQKGRAAGLYAAVKVQHTCSSAGQVS
jgi:hypothetical protein